jgi:hypothetical protein
VVVAIEAVEASEVEIEADSVVASAVALVAVEATEVAVEVSEAEIEAVAEVDLEVVLTQPETLIKETLSPSKAIDKDYENLMKLT